MIWSSGLRLPESSSSSLVAARGHALLGKSSGDPSSNPWSVSTLLPKVSLKRVVTGSLAQGWPQASHDCFSHSELASGETELVIPNFQKKRS
jgi:hypothetical protein